MKMYNKYLSLTLFMLLLLFSCSKKNYENADGNENLGNEETVYYEVLSDDKYEVLSIVDQMFSTIVGNDQIEMVKTMLVNMFNNQLDDIKEETGLEDITLGFRKIMYVYKSTDAEDNPINLSASALWRGYFSDGNWYDYAPDNICLMEHYTITSDAEAPSQTFPVEMFITGNTLTIMPDYIGFGITKDMVQPYLVYDLCAINSIDAMEPAYHAFRSLSNLDVKDGWKSCVMGASQGSANALAVHKHFDTHTDIADRWNFAYSYSAAGPHNPEITLQKILEIGKYSNPAIMTILFKSMIEYYPDIMKDVTEDMMYSESYLAIKDTVDAMIQSKNHSIAEINNVIFQNVKHTVDANLADDEIYLSDILSDDMLNPDSQLFMSIKQCLSLNDLTKDWYPTHPIRLHYSSGDRVVPHENTLAVQEAFGQEMVSVTAAPQPVDHLVECLLWMLSVLLQGV